jgi:hypothetical protein
LTPVDDDPTHTYACFYPTGTPLGEDAARENLQVGQTAAGVPYGDAAEAAR